MPERNSYAPGTPSWIDIGTDVEGAKAFYGALLGWDPVAAGPVEETGGYGFFTKRGLQVAGYGPQMNPGPPFWTTYISVDDADATAEAVKSAGGQVMMAPMDVMAAGRMAVCIDPTGAFFSLWQPKEHHGCQLVNEPGSLSWNELNTRDPEAAKDFYGAVFGWKSEAHDMPGGATYTEFLLDGRPVGGMLDMRGHVPDEVPAHWMIYIAVEDCDASVASATELGGSVQVPPTDIPAGRFSVIADPQGAHLAVIKLAEM